MSEKRTALPAGSPRARSRRPDLQTHGPAGPAAQLDAAKRFAEIVAILQKHHPVQGLTPEQVRDIFVDLGPTSGSYKHLTPPTLCSV